MSQRKRSFFGRDHMGEVDGEKEKERERRKEEKRKKDESKKKKERKKSRDEERGKRKTIMEYLPRNKITGSGSIVVSEPRPTGHDIIVSTPTRSQSGRLRGSSESGLGNGEFKAMLKVASVSSNLGGVLMALSLVEPPGDVALSDVRVNSNAVASFVRQNMEVEEFKGRLPLFVDGMTMVLVTLQRILEKVFNRSSLPYALHQYMSLVFHDSVISTEVRGMTWMDLYKFPERPLQCLLSVEFLLATTSTAIIGDDALFIDEGLFALAEEMCLMFRGFTCDPYSAIIGLEPLPQVAKFIWETPSQTAAKNASKKRLLQAMLELSMTADPAEMQAQLRDHAVKLRGVRDMSTGALVMARESCDSPFRFARFSGKIHAGGVEVYFTPEQYDQGGVRVPPHDVFPINPPLLMSLEKCVVPDLTQYVQIPHEEFLKSILAVAREEVFKSLHLDPFSLDQELIERVKMGELDINDFSVVQRVYDFFAHPEKLSDANAFSSARAVLEKMRSEFPDALPFKPKTKNLSLVVRPFCASDVIEGVLNDIYNEWTPMLEKLKKSQSQWIDGTKKNELVSWWLALIRTRVDELLAELGYNQKAIPWNYVQDRPEDMEEVDRNMSIVKELLKKDSEGNQRVLALIADLQATIYPRINAFVEMGERVLCSMLNITSEDLEKTPPEELLKEKGDELSRENFDALSDLIKDVNYLTEMKKMEDPKYALENEVNFHIVPISGLVMSSFIRLENECKTVLELWAPELLQEKVEANPKGTHLHQYLADNNTEKFLSELDDCSASLLNSKDKNGWTVLHVTANSVDLLPICEKLVFHPDIDVTQKNRDGNTALHYLVRARVTTEKNKARKSRIMKRMVGKGVDVNQRNKHGEAPLHMSCWSGNPDMVRILLEAGGDPNLVTSKGVSCMYFAVRQGSLEVVRALASFGARLDAASPETPLELAKMRRLDTIVDFLEREIKERSAVASGGATTEATCIEATECGLIVDAFLPLHHGHLSLINSALDVAEHVHIVIAANTSDPIPHELRMRWLLRCLIDRPEFPEKVTLCTRIGFASPKDVVMTDEECVRWSKTIRASELQPAPQVLFCFDQAANGSAQARSLQLTHVPVSLPLDVLPSGDVLKAPLDHWVHLPPAVRSYFVKRVTVLGADPVSRRTLAAALSEHFTTLMMPEFRMEYHALCGRDLRADDVEKLAKKLIQRQEALSGEANKLLICDTDDLFVAAWSRANFSQIPQSVLERLEVRKSALYIVTSISETTTAPTKDGTTACAYSGVVLQDEILALLKLQKANYLVVQSAPDGNVKSAVDAVTKLL